MTVVPKELYFVGFAIGILNIGMGIQFGGQYVIVNVLSGGCVLLVCLWSLIGAPGAKPIAKNLNRMLEKK